MTHDNSNLPPGVTQDNEEFDLTDIPLKECGECNGTGQEPFMDKLDGEVSYLKCLKCDGTGLIPKTIEDIEAEREEAKEPKDL